MSALSVWCVFSREDSQDKRKRKKKGGAGGDQKASQEEEEEASKMFDPLAWRRYRLSVSGSQHSHDFLRSLLFSLSFSSSSHVALSLYVYMSLYICMESSFLLSLHARSSCVEISRERERS